MKTFMCNCSQTFLTYSAYLPFMAFLALLSFIFTPISELSAKDSRPNFVVILTDDQGWGDLSSNGNTALSTPHIDSLGKDGATFDRFFVCPVCSPTRAEFLTGRYSARSGVYSTSAGGERIDLDETTIGDVFKEAGYATGAFGKWHNGLQWPYHPNARGFDEYYGFCSGHWGHYFSPQLDHNQQVVKGKGFVVDDFTDHAIKFIEKNKDRPFFCYVPYNTPHSPMQVPDSFFEKFKNPNMKGMDGMAMNDHHRAALAMCENVDYNVGRILKVLDELKIAENTLVFYFSDNGPNAKKGKGGQRWNGGMKGRKGSTDEGGVRVPGLMRWPAKIKPGSVIEEIACGMDLLPTFMAMAGINRQMEKPLDGKNILPLITGEAQSWPDRMLVQAWKGKVTVRNQRYRLDTHGKLFDMVKDPTQKKPVKVPEIQQAMLKVQKEFKDTVLKELDPSHYRPHPVGHPETDVTWLPARDGSSHGGVERSNRFPNDSHFRNWKTKEGKITWKIEVLTSGTYEAELWYTCSKENVGCELELSMGNAKTSPRTRATITKVFDPPLVGEKEDRSVRGESYVKDFAPAPLGQFQLAAGQGTLTLSALKIPGDGVVDVRFIKLTRK